MSVECMDTDGKCHHVIALVSADLLTGIATIALNPCLMKPGVQCRIYKGCSGNIPSSPQRVTTSFHIKRILVYITNSVAYGTRRFNAAFTRALQ